MRNEKNTENKIKEENRQKHLKNFMLDEILSQSKK